MKYLGIDMLSHNLVVCSNLKLLYETRNLRLRAARATSAPCSVCDSRTRNNANLARDIMAGRVPTGFAAETYISDHTFRQGHRAIEGGNTKKRKREGKGDTSVVSGAGAYKGPWARYEEERPDAASNDEYGSDEEVEIIYEEDELEDNPAPASKKLAGTDYHDTEAESETSEFVGSQQYDYQGRTYMHVPNGILSRYTPRLQS